MSAALVFAIGFLMRPIGAWYFGRMADRVGRRVALTRSVMLMAAGSLLIAVTPGYEQIGLAAPAVLLVARMAQGLSLGGEYGASATFLSESAHRNRRGFWSSFIYVSVILGQLLAVGSLVVLHRAVGEAALNEWAFRVPFVLGAGAALVALWLRTSLEETESFRRSGAQEKRGTLKALREHPREFSTVVGLTLGGTVDPPRVRAEPARDGESSLVHVAAA
ncbi:MAG: MFS transporter, partial [Archangium sp.]|nr:MFS transporter [Archangium sp.]